MKIGIVSDHRGYKLKEYLIKNLNLKLIDYGTDSTESTDYPDYAFILGEKVVNKEVDLGIAICGSGIGISIACNKVQGIRCAKVNNIEEAKVTRNDNDANIIALSEKTSNADALLIVNAFVKTDFSNEKKHIKRINKIIEFEGNK